MTSIPYFGEIAALCATVCFTIGPTFFTLAGRRVNAITVNRARLIVTAVLLVIFHWGVTGSPLPSQVSLTRWLWFGMSGVFGLVIGDTLLFQAFVLIGTRLTMLVVSVSPVLTTLLGWMFLGEVLTAAQLAGVIITVSGIVWVVSDRNNEVQDVMDRASYMKGLSLALLGAVVQVLGLITAKKGLEGEFLALSGHLVRVLVSVALISVLAIFQGQVRPTYQRLSDTPQAFRYVLLGSVVGPLIGKWLALLAIQKTNVGIASTLLSLTPILLLPVGVFIFHERVGGRAILGTLLSLAGVALIFTA